MAANSQNFLRNIWYFALPSHHLKAGEKLVGKQFLGEPILFGRNTEGKAFALRDVCPHRGIPLSYGRFDQGQVECCYHGWRFGTDGMCQHIPSLCGDEGIEATNIKVRSYSVIEQQGAIWIFMADPLHTMTDPPTPSELPELPTHSKPILTEVMNFPCFVDHAVVGLMDPAHGPFVHTSWWWRSRKSIHQKAKKFGPKPFGFAMLRHQPSSNSFAYKLLGGKPETEISFRLPGVRVEHIRVGKNYVVNLTSVTPISESSTEITHSIYTNISWVVLIKPLLRIFARNFLGQDRRVVVQQQEGLRHEDNLLLIRDADTQARWYYQLKKEYQAAYQEQREFQNPVKEVTLKWRS